MALDSIGPYQFKGILGRGGMGTVYRGIHNDTGELHAVKVLAPTYAHDPHFRGRFESCLLYTSPSPRDATLSRMPSSA